MKRALIFIISMLLPLIHYSQKRDIDIYTLIEKATHNRNDTDIVNAFNFIVLGRCVNNEEIKLTQILDAIKDNEIIIEFFERPDSTGGNTYFAFVVKNNLKIPKLYKICEETELTFLFDKDKNFYNNVNVLQLILCSIMDELNGVRNIYYIPCGKLHKIALEYCRCANGKMFCENFNVFRLTSSSELCSNRHRKDYHHYSIWGGVDIEQELFNCEEDTCLEVYDTRQFYYLEDSFTAAKLISEELRIDGKKTVDFYHDETSTENNFKNMSGKNIDAFLIETHGIFTRECSISTKNGQAPLDNHALALCGAVSIMDRGIIPSGFEDGLITEEEISRLDFSNMDLAVISACKSGLGKIEWDGVHGLMRGFKIAGVNSLIMTLDDVVDYVSGQLWIQFFRNLNDGQSKREALLNGIGYIKTMDNGVFSHPKFWTPFILIDGLD